MKNVIVLFLLIVLSTQVTLSQCVEGDCENGYGTILYRSGNKYQGEFNNGLKHGYGKFIWKSGSKYKGGWVQNMREGEGEEILTNGNRYVGQWQSDKKHGTGIVYDASNNVIQQGTWSSGMFINNAKSIASKKGTAQNSLKSRSNSQLSNTKKIKTMDSYANIGVGVGNLYTSGFSYGSDASLTGIPPVSLSIDLFEATDKIKIGGFLGYTSNRVKYSDSFYGEWGWKTSWFILGVRGTYSYNLFNNPQLDTYVGAMLGYNVVRSTSFGDEIFGSVSSGSAASGLTYSGFIGVRYLFKEHMGAFAELGYGISYLTVGLTQKF